jgi:hypothetical protein
MTGKPLAFTGKIAYICPHCGTEQRFLEVECRARGHTLASFRIEGQMLSMTDVDLSREHFRMDSMTLVLGPLRCPRCKTDMTIVEIREGFSRWLERLRERDPKQHAEIVAELL